MKKKVKLILPALTEAKSPYWRPIKYSLFPPLGLATLAGYLPSEYDITIQDEHVEELNLNDDPDLVLIQVYITNAYRSYSIADHYRKKGAKVALGGLHVTSLPDEAMIHADSIFIGPAEQSFPEFLQDYKENKIKKRYFSSQRTLENMPLPRRDLIKRHLYLVPNSLVVSRGCPHNCSFCYKESFFAGGKSFYVQTIDKVLDEINRLPGRHLYFLDDHLLGNPRFARELFQAMKGMNRVFQAAATVDSILKDDLIELAAEAGLRSLFVGFETLSPENLSLSNKFHNLSKSYEKAIARLHNAGIMINGSFVFGLDDDWPDVFKQTVDWAINTAITTATFHILTPYPGTEMYKKFQIKGRIITKNWDLYDTRHAVYRPVYLSRKELETGYHNAYREFYTWSNIAKASLNHENLKQTLKHFIYTGAWKKLEPFWNFIIKTEGLRYMLPLLEAVLSKASSDQYKVAGTKSLIIQHTNYGLTGN